MTTASDHAEQLAQPEIRRLQLERLSAMLIEIGTSNAFWRAKFAAVGFDQKSVQTLADLGQLPVTTKDDLVRDQQSHPPYGSNLTFDRGKYSRMHQTSGTTGSPLRW